MNAICLTERDREVWTNELAPYLPNRVLDVHVHVFPADCFPAGFELPEKSCYRKFGGEHRLGTCMEIAALILPGIDFSALCFGTPDIAVDRERAAEYLGGVIDNRHIFGMALVSPEDTIEEIERRIVENRLVGYKPYRNLVTWKEPESVSIPDMLPHEQMVLADRLGLGVMLHIPRSKRLADLDNQREMAEICRKYPNAKIIFAHIGRAYYLQNVVGNIEFLAEFPNAYIDLAMLNHADVIEYAIRSFPVDRILFGSDAPIAWLRGKSVEINNQYAYLMGEDYRIGTAIHDTEHAVEFTFFYYEILRATLTACRRADLTGREIEGIFCRNSSDLLLGIADSLPVNGARQEKV